MNFYLAPMEGITGYVYRNAYNKYYGNIDRYFTPFLVANQNVSLKTREIRDIMPENNLGMEVIPQILTNNSVDFIELSKLLRDEYGYQEVNLNLGCPSGTVVTKKKGAGFLQDTDRMKSFFDEVFYASVTKISVKTRIGMYDNEEFDEILDIFRQYPFSELIIHPRVREDFYRNKPDWNAFSKAANSDCGPICYNGDIFTTEDYDNFTARFPDTQRIMLGRGILSNPFLVGQINGDKQVDKDRLYEFYNCLVQMYRQDMGSDNNVLFKMKELWIYMGKMFSNYDSYSKKIKKASSLTDLNIAVNNLFESEE